MLLADSVLRLGQEKEEKAPILAGTWIWLCAGAGWELWECSWFTPRVSPVGGAGASGSSRCFLEHHLSPRSPQGAGAVPGISAAWWLLCTKRKHGAGCLQSLRMLPGLPELMLLFQHSSFSSCSLKFTPVFSLHMSIRDQVTGCLSSLLQGCHHSIFLPAAPHRHLWALAQSS